MIGARQPSGDRGPREPPGEGVPSAPPGFRLADDLGPGVTLLEASAGTGKTHTIANLAVRYLASGVGVDRLLVVTFTRAATGELRERVRERLVLAEAALAGAVAGRPVPDDELADLLVRGTPAEVEVRSRALSAALSDFDAATITTIHAFCEQMLRGLGTASDCTRDLRFVDDLAPVIDEVTDDFYVRKFVDRDQPPFARSLARDVVASAVYNRDAAICPSADGADDDGPTVRARLAAAGRREVVRRIRAAGLAGYDDQLELLRDTLAGPSGPIALERLRRRFGVVLVDEFQDTDPVQWDIFRTAFAHERTRLLLIGDPKQAIYSFRGGDVWAYLAASRLAAHRFTLATNWRSDQPLIDAVDALLAGSTLGHPEIPYRRVTAAAGRESSGLAGAPDPSPLRLRVLHRSDGLARLLARGQCLQADSARRAVAADLAAEVVKLLSSAATRRGPGGAMVPLGAGDLAVLVRTNQEAAVVHQALDERGVPAVVAGGGSVFGAAAARHWLTLLEALERPSSTSRVRAAALSPLVGWDVARLAAAGADELDDLQATMHRWAARLAADGVAALAGTVAAETGLVGRELTHVGGERSLTDLRHVAELLHAEAVGSGAGGRSLTAWLQDRVTEASTATEVEERSRRLESDADAVQIQTIHRSKGLEFPVVYLPYLWMGSPERGDQLLFHDPADADRRTIDVGGRRDSGYQPHRSLAEQESCGEDLRQAYVALTRARHQVVAWWATVMGTKTSPLARILLGRGPDGSVPGRAAQVPGDDAAVAAAALRLAERAPGGLSVERVGPLPAPSRWSPPVPVRGALDASVFGRTLDTDWGRSSYSAITAAAHRAHRSEVTSEAESRGLTDEPAPSLGDDPGEAPVAADPVRTDPERQSLVSPMAGLQAGAAFGLEVHALLEALDFTTGDVPTAVAGALAAARPGGGAPDPDGPALAAALEAVVATPLGPLAGGARLRDVARRDRLDELSFELPVAGGDVPVGTVEVGDVGACLRRWLREGQPLAGYADRLDDPSVARVLRGYLTGSIDAVLRLDGPRYLVVDYKTNWLGPPGQTLTTWHYRREAMEAAMVAEHYPLQAVLYSVALHRYLRWRQPGYDPERHLGGVLYLFVRGMARPASGDSGVFSWSAPPGMIAELSDLLDRGAAR